MPVHTAAALSGSTEKDKTNTLTYAVYTTNDTPRGHHYHTTTIISPVARGRGRPGGTQEKGDFCFAASAFEIGKL